MESREFLHQLTKTVTPAGNEHFSQTSSLKADGSLVAQC